MTQGLVEERKMTTIAEWLSKRCRDDGLSYRKAAAKAGLSHATISAIRKGSRPSADTIMKLAKAFSNDGTQQRLALEEELFILAGYRSRSIPVTCREPMARLMDLIRDFDDEQLKLVAGIIEYSSQLGNKHGAEKESLLP